MTVVLASGGLDSTVLLAEMAMKDLPNGEDTIALFFAYPSKHNLYEYDALRKVVAHMNAQYHHPTLTEGIEIVEVKIDNRIWDSSDSKLLVGNAPVPHADYVQQGPQPTVVEGRNMLFLAHALALAMSRKQSGIAIAAHASDAEHWAYPDCTPEFMGSMMNAVAVSSMGEVRMYAPYINLDKAYVLERIKDLPIQVPVGLTRSCYQDLENHCGVCPTCKERKRAFEHNNQWLDDETEYAA